jgi:ribosomal protein S12 methylthiotransferase accessory factor YcaO
VNNNNNNNNNISNNLNDNEASNQNYFSCLKVNKKISKPIKNYKTEKKEKNESYLEAHVDNSNSDFDEEDHLEDISKEELDEQKQIFIPSHHFDVRIPKNNSVKNFSFRSNFMNFEKDISQNNKIVNIYN